MNSVKSYLNRFVSIFLIIALIIVGAGCTGGKTTSADQNNKAKEPISIGIVNPMTGPSADLGLASKIGATLAMNEVNAKGGVNGRQLKLVFRDTQGDPQKAVSLTKELLDQQNVDVLMGANLTNEATAVNPILNQNKKLFITMGTGVELVNPEKFPYTLRLNLDTSREAGVLVKYAVETKGAKKIGVISDSSAYGQSGINAIKNKLKELGLTPVATQSFNLGDTDMTPQVLALKDSGAEIVIAYSFGAQLAHVALAMKKINWQPQTLAGIAVHQLNFPDLAGDAGENFWGTTQRPFTLTKTSPAPESVTRFIETAIKEFGKDADSSYLPNAAIWYDMVKLYAQTVAETKVTDSAKVKEGWEKTTQYKGLASTYSFSPTMHDGFSTEDIVIAHAVGVVKHIRQQIGGVKE